MLDFTSLLLAIFLSAGCLSAVLCAAWATSRTDGFLLTCALGALLVAISVVCSAFYTAHPQRWLVCLAYAFLLTGLATIYGTAWQFRHDASPWRAITVVSAISLGLTLPPHALGYNGVGFIVGFLSSAGLLFLAAYNFWMSRQEARGTLTSLAALYFILGLSFLPRAALVLADGRAVLPGAPQNWAQNISLALIIAALPALGALTLVLNQKRLIRIHQQQALTDPLTGLPNRRALLERFAGDPGPVTLVMFDIDRFKGINDTRGHAVGDLMIALFARTLMRLALPGQIPARLGGDEFVLAAPDGDLSEVIRQAEEIRRIFAERARVEHELNCTASGGLAQGTVDANAFAALLAKADVALYRAKNQGRDRLILVDDAATSMLSQTG